MASPRWPATLWIVRHGESTGNIARDEAHARGAQRIELTMRDVDVPLSPLGETQARTTGRWFADRPAEQRPDILLASPYLRAQRTAQLFLDCGGGSLEGPVAVDERLREKEFGILDGLTTGGIAAVFPDQAEFRRILGKFYHRPPGGESWCDVIFRLRSLMDTIALHYAGRRVMIVAHQVVVLCLRYIIENMDEATILAIDREAEVGNCAITEYRFDPALGTEGGLALVHYNDVSHLEERSPSIVTATPDATGAVRG